jgi:C-terminal processing protease CtpA/Prc
MKWLLTFASVCAVTAAVWADPVTQRLDAATDTAKALAAKEDYRGAAEAIGKLESDHLVTGVTGWPDAQLEHARYLAKSGDADKAMATLTQAVALGAMVKANDLAKDAAFTALRDRPAFKALQAKLEQRNRLWQDSPAIATPYKPVLSDEEKAAGVSKIWAEARFNFPFFDRIPDLDWDAAYVAALADARATKTTEDYYRALTRFMGQLKDGHSRVLPPTELQDRMNGVTAVDTRLIEGKIIVTGVSDPTLAAKGVRVGSEIVRIDGEPALEYAKAKVAPNVSGYTQQDRDVWQYGFQLLRGPVDKPAQVVLKDAQGKTVTVDLPRKHNDGPFGFAPKIERTASFKILPGDVAYLEVNWFMDDAGIKTLKENFAAASAAKGLIIDIRQNGGGNSDYADALARALADKPYLGSRWRGVDYRATYRSWNRPIGWVRGTAPTFTPDPNLHYAKPVVVLVSGRTYSAAEDFLVAYVSSGRGKLVGETSGGSTGNPLLFKLPGGGMAFICAKDDSFGDGRIFEGVGIAPDVTVKPTIADIRQGRDPVLEKAIAIIKASR